GGARGLGPAAEARGRPLGVRPMRVRHVGGLGGVLAAAPASAMRGDAPAFEKQFDRGGGEADLDPLMHELVGDAVVVVLDEDVVVDVTPASRHSANSYRLAGSGRSSGRSSCSNNARRETPSFRIGRALSGVSNSRTAAFRSARLKKRRWRSTARIQRCATSTFASTTAS